MMTFCVRWCLQTWGQFAPAPALDPDEVLKLFNTELRGLPQMITPKSKSSLHSFDESQWYSDEGPRKDAAYEVFMQGHKHQSNLYATMYMANVTTTSVLLKRIGAMQQQ